MQARSALFDLYGDHLRWRGGRAPVAAVVRLLAPLGITAPAVRTAISRMLREGWLAAERLPDGPGYALTQRAERRLAEASARIYRTRAAAADAWDGSWELVVLRPLRGGGVGAVPGRAARSRLRAGLEFLGYAPLDPPAGSGWATTWIAAWASPELDGLLEGEDVAAERFRAETVGGSDSPAALVRRAWDLEELGRAYDRWTDDAKALVAEAPGDRDPDGPGDSADSDDPGGSGGAGGSGGSGGRDDGARPGGGLEGDEQAYAIRFHLVHEWRKFLFRDPALPRALLPADWPGIRAAEFFDAEAGRLFPAASRFVDACLSGPTRA